MKGWYDMGVKVKFFVAYQGRIECHDYVDFYQLKPSFITRLRWKYIESCYDVITAQYLKGKVFVPSIRNTFNQLREFLPDAVVIRNYSLGNLKIIFLCRLLGIKKIVMYVQEPLYGKYMYRMGWKEVIKKILFPNAVFTPVLYNGVYRSKEQMTGLADSFIPLISENTRLQNRVYCPEGIIRLLDIGKYRPYKNHFFIVDALSRVKQPELFKLTIIGQLSNDIEKRYFSELEEYIRRKKLQNIISLRGEIDYKAMQSIYKQHDILILASKELASISVVEAMANGLCVIGSIFNGTSCYIDEFDCGKTFDCTNIESLVNTLNFYINNIDAIQNSGMKAMAVVKEHLSFNVYRDGLFALINDKC